MPTEETYTGQTNDASTGLMHYGARYYDPNLRRFISADTIIPNPANPADHNRYTYTVNNPIRYTDPTGHDPCAGGGGGCGGVRQGDHNGDGFQLGYDCGVDCGSETVFVNKNGGKPQPNPQGAAPDVGLVLNTFERVPGAACGYNQAGIATCEQAYWSASPNVSGRGWGPNQARWCVEHASLCLEALVAGLHATAEAARQFPDPEQFNQRNAFMHAYWIGQVAQYDPAAAWELGLAHEADQNEGPHDTRRDLVNNALGIQVASAVESNLHLRDVLVQAAQEGYLACLGNAQDLIPCTSP